MLQHKSPDPRQRRMATLALADEAMPSTWLPYRITCREQPEHAPPATSR